MLPSLLNWIVITLSLINTILLIWLGLTVILNADQRTWGIWMISGGLLLGGVFFISHTAILGYGLTSLDSSINFWWHLGLLAALILPFQWYIVMLWYSGFWEDRSSALYKRHRVYFPLNSAVTLISIGLLFFANPFSSFTQVVNLQLSRVISIGEVPLMIIFYMISTVLNVGISLDVLRRPGPIRRMMGDLARDRARPWLLATAITLMFVGILIAAVMTWVASQGHELILSGLVTDMTRGIAWFDMVISALITLSVLFLGQAIVRYEVFTGKTLPQRRFMRHWRNVVILAFGCGTVLSAALVRNIHPIYLLLVMIVLVTVFYALLNHNSYAERERYIQHLRPFVTSQNLYDHFLARADPAQIDLHQPFESLCANVLGTQLAYLTAVGPLAPLMGGILTYPQHTIPLDFPLADLYRQFTSPTLFCVPVDPVRYGNACWAVPLWSERGLIGMLLLGEKHNGGLYTQEEIEIARASGERMIDTKASAELGQRLVNLQRQRLSESHVVDRRTRRVLHDDILPRLHEVMLTLNMDKSAVSQAGVQALTTLHRDIADLLHTMPRSYSIDITNIGLISALHNLITNDFAQEFDEVIWNVQAEAETCAQHLSPFSAEVLYFAAREATRNAARHARGDSESRSLQLTIEIVCENGIQISIRDNGIGIDNWTKTPRMGNGLTLHSTMMAVVGGSMSIDQMDEKGTTVILRIPSP